MSQPISELTQELTRNEGVPAPKIREVVSKLGVAPPADYLSFLSTSNGGEGPIGANGYAAFWPAERLQPLNDAYHVAEFAPSLVLFGSDGGDVAYAFDKRAVGRIVAVPFVGMRDDNVQVLGSSFVEFLQRIATGGDF